MSTTIDFRLIRQLWMFLAVAEEQHFGRAAQKLNMSQPPLTEQIKVLEQSLKMQLFERSRLGTRLSPAGAAILPAVRQFAGQVEQLERVVREISSGQSGVLHVGAITSAMLETVPPLLDALKSIAWTQFPHWKPGSLTLRLYGSRGKSAAISPRSHSQRTGLPLPCTRITHWRPSLAYA